jgi:hypothetical protein
MPEKNVVLLKTKRNSPMRTTAVTTRIDVVFPPSLSDSGFISSLFFGKPQT